MHPSWELLEWGGECVSEGGEGGRKALGGFLCFKRMGTKL